ncbi:unnamed protein product [Arabidopsis halleri]
MSIVLSMRVVSVSVRVVSVSVIVSVSLILSIGLSLILSLSTSQSLFPSTRQSTTLRTKVFGDTTATSCHGVGSGEEQVVVASREENGVASGDISKFIMWSGELGLRVRDYRNKNFRLLEKKLTSVTCLDSNINFWYLHR